MAQIKDRLVKQYPNLFGRSVRIIKVEYQTTNELNYYITFDTDSFGPIVFYGVVNQDGQVRI